MDMYKRYCKVRDEKGVTDATVAKNTGIGKSTFSDWKSGRSIPKTDKVLKIANYLDVSLDFLLYGYDLHNSNYEASETSRHIDGEKGLMAILEAIYGRCELETIDGKYSSCFYFSVSKDENRFAIQEDSFNKLYESVKTNIKSMVEMIKVDEQEEIADCKKTVNTPPDYNDIPDKYKKDATFTSAKAI